MSRAIAFILLGFAVIVYIPASIYSLRHPRYRGDPWTRGRIASVTMSTLAMAIVMLISVVALVTGKGR
jgi:hypothetical protein